MAQCNATGQPSVARGTHRPGRPTRKGRGGRAGEARGVAVGRQRVSEVGTWGRGGGCRGVTARRATRLAPLNWLHKNKISVQVLQILPRVSPGVHAFFLECRAAACQFATEIDTNFTQVLSVKARKLHAGFVANVAGFAASERRGATRHDSQKRLRGRVLTRMWKGWSPNGEFCSVSERELNFAFFVLAIAAAMVARAKPATKPARHQKEMSVEMAGLAWELPKPATKLAV